MVCLQVPATATLLTTSQKYIILTNTPYYHCVRVEKPSLFFKKPT